MGWLETVTRAFNAVPATTASTTQARPATRASLVEKLPAGRLRRLVAAAFWREGERKSRPPSPLQPRHERAILVYGLPPVHGKVPSAAVRRDAFFSDPWWHRSEVKKPLPDPKDPAVKTVLRPDGSRILSETRHRLVLLDGRAVHQVRRVLLTPRERRFKEFSILDAQGASLAMADIAAVLPLFAAERFDAAKHKEIVVAEGVAATEALIGMGFAVAGTLTGALHTPSREALSRLTLFATVYLWPDNDSIGVRHMERIAQRLHNLGAKDIRVIRWTGGPRKGDAADFQEAAAGVKKLMADARRWSPGSEARHRGQLALHVPRVPGTLELPQGARAPVRTLAPPARAKRAAPAADNRKDNQGQDHGA